MTYARTLLTSALVAAAMPAAGQETENPALSVELNGTGQEGAACRLTFVVENRMGADLETAVFETVLFDKAGAVLTLTLFDFGALPEGRSRVRQFDLAETDCGSLGRVLLNGAHACKGEGIDAAACDAGLALSTRTDVEILG
jgi:hypothetical protein